MELIRISRMIHMDDLRFMILIIFILVTYITLPTRTKLSILHSVIYDMKYIKLLDLII